MRHAPAAVSSPRPGRPRGAVGRGAFRGARGNRRRTHDGMIATDGPVSRKFGATPVFDTYWHFAVERQRVFFRRLRDDLVLTTDAIIAQHRFTNAYRAADRVSQYLIARVIPGSEPTPNDLFFRILLFKIFNKIDTWEYPESPLGQLHFDIPLASIDSA